MAYTLNAKQFLIIKRVIFTTESRNFIHFNKNNTLRTIITSSFICAHKNLHYYGITGGVSVVVAAAAFFCSGRT